MNNVLILGLGYVGLTLAVHCAKKQFNVFGVEVNNAILSSLANKKSHFHEPQINSYLEKHLGKNLQVSNIIDSDAGRSDIIIISVGTPLNKNNNEPRMDYLDNVLETILPYLSEEKLLILRSTVPVGTSRKILLSLKKKLGFQPLIAFCPERTAEGQALEELESLPQIISGSNNKAVKLARDFFNSISAETVLVENLEAAELIKLFNNTFRDSMFALANNFNLIAQSFGINGQKLIEFSNYNYARSYIPKPGFVAGPCLEKDAFILSSNVDGIDLKNEIEGSRRVNGGLEEKFSSRIKAVIHNLEDPKVVITGLAFKGHPATNDLRGSPALNIVCNLKKYSKNIHLHDFMNEGASLSEVLPGFHTMDSADIWNIERENCDLLIILNNHESYSSVKFAKMVGTLMKDGCDVYDCWNVLDFEGTRSLGNMFISKEVI